MLGAITSKKNLKILHKNPILLVLSSLSTISSFRLNKKDVTFTSVVEDI